MSKRRWSLVLATAAAAGLLDAGCSNQHPIYNCGPVDDIQLPGAPARPWSGCGGNAGYMHAAKAPEFTLHVGDRVELTEFFGTPETSDSRILRISSDAATISRTDAGTTGIRGEARAIGVGTAQLQIKGYSCFDGNPKHGAGCVIMRIRVLP